MFVWKDEINEKDAGIARLKKPLIKFLVFSLLFPTLPMQD